MTHNILSLIGNTPLIELSRIFPQQHIRVFAKYEMANPSLSIKDRIVFSMVQALIEKHRLTPGKTIVEASSGNTGTSLAMITAALGYKCVICCPAKTSNEKVLSMRLYGATVHVCPNTTIDNKAHYFNRAQAISNELNAPMLNQYENQNNPQAHFHSTGPEIWQQTEGKVDVFLTSASSGGTVSGIARYLKSKNPDIKVVLADPKGSYYKWYFENKDADKTFEFHGTKLEGIGKDYLCKTMDMSLIDDVISVNDDEAFATVKALASKEGVLVGLSSAANCVAIKSLAEKLEPRNKPYHIVTVLPDSGFKYLSKLGPQVQAEQQTDAAPQTEACYPISD